VSLSRRDQRAEWIESMRCNGLTYARPTFDPATIRRSGALRQAVWATFTRSVRLRRSYRGGADSGESDYVIL
jgi:hypothetical protein